MLFGLGGMAAAGACMVSGVGGALVLAALSRSGGAILPTQASLPTSAPAVASPTVPLPVPPPIISREAWGGLPPNHAAENETGFYSPDNVEGWYTYSMPLADVYQTLVLHHSVVYHGNDLATMQAIEKLHRVDRGWATIGYHYLIGRNGGIYEARPLTVRGVHVAGHNTGSAGVCLMGNFVNDDLTEEQRGSTMLLLQWLTALLPKVTHLAAHGEFNSDTQCPGSHLYPFLDPAAAQLGLLRGTGGYQAPADATPAP